MIVTVVTDVLGEANNGTTIACMNLVNFLKKKGHDVRIVCPDADKKGQLNYFVAPTYSFGFLDFIVEANGVSLAKGDSLILMRAIKEADEVHIMTPFSLARKAVKVANYLGKPVSCGFHVQAENVTAHFFFFQKVKWINHLVYLNFYNKLYKYVDAIHFPTQFIRDTFEKHIKKTTPGYVISNGVNAQFRKRDVVRPKELEGKFVIMMIGRYSKEKSQKILVKAASMSKYKDKLHLIFAGEGPRKKQLEKQVAKLIPGQAEFNFYDRDSLVDALSMCDLYVHTSTIEIEAISCLEAIATGLVPVINNSPGSATRYFALEKDNLFKCDDPEDLAKKIDYWIEHPEEKKKAAEAYAGFSAGFEFEACMQKMEDMVVATSKIKKPSKDGKEG